MFGFLMENVWIFQFEKDKQKVFDKKRCVIYMERSSFHFWSFLSVIVITQGHHGE